MSKFVQIDYDGTIATTNIGLAIQERLAKDPELFQLLRMEFNTDIIDVVTATREGWANVKPDGVALKRLVKDTTIIRHSFFSFISRCYDMKYMPIVVSNGMGFYIFPYINVPLIAGTAILTKKRMYGFLPCDLKLAAAEMLKPHIYIGDGKSDIAPSAYARKVFAVKGGELAKIPGTIVFESFDEILTKRKNCGNITL